MKGLILSEEKRFFIVGSNDNNFVRVSKKSFKDKQYGEEIVFAESDLYVTPFQKLLSMNIFRSNILVYSVVTAILLLGLNILSYDTETKQFSLKEDPFGIMSAFDSGRSNSVAYKDKDTSSPSVDSSLKGKDKDTDRKSDEKTSDEESLLNTSKEGMVAINDSDNSSIEENNAVQTAEPKQGLSLISEPSLLKVRNDESEFLQESTGLDGVNVDSKTVDIANFLRSSSSLRIDATTESMKVNNLKSNSNSDGSVKRTTDSLEQKESGSLVAVIDKPSKDFNKEITSDSGIKGKPSDKGNGLPIKEDTKNPDKQMPKPPVQRPVVTEPADNKLEEKPHNDEEEDVNTGKEEGSKPYNPNVPIETEDGMVAGSDYEKELEKNNHDNNGNGNQGNNGSQGNGNANGNQDNTESPSDNKPTMPEEDTKEPTMPEEDTKEPTMPEEDTKEPTMPEEDTKEPTMPEEDTKEPTMPNTCNSDGYYYDKENVLFFEPDENGEMREVWKEIEVKKICN